MHPAGPREAPYERINGGECQMPIDAPSERVGRSSAPRPMVLNLPPRLGDARLGRRFTDRAKRPSEDDDDFASSDQRQLSEVELGDRIFLLGDDLVDGLDFGDVRFDGDLVHDSLRPVECLGLLVPDCARCGYLDEVVLSFQDPMPVTRVRVSMSAHRDYHW
jgi:hypothetical protein